MRVRLALNLGFVLGFVPALMAASPNRLEVFPSQVHLKGPEASQRFVVLGSFDDGMTRDVTDQSRIEPGKLGFVWIDEHNRVRPASNGQGEVLVRVGDAVARIPVSVEKARAPRVVSFKNEVAPVLTKLGCNQGACHGGQHGKGGFKLSLLGFEPNPDFIQIVKSAEGRRVTPFAPEESLLLQKPALEVAHGGGKRLQAGSPEYELLRLWLEQGAPGPIADEAVVKGLTVLPSRRVLEPGQDQHLVAIATLSDGSERDVTAEAKFDTLNEGVAKVDSIGLAHTIGQGETNILVRYQGYASLSRLTVPYATDRPFAFEPNNVIDEKAAAKWRALGLSPSPSCTDVEFLRRAMLDTIGTTPNPSEIEDFLADTSRDKRAKLIDSLLNRPEYVDFWSLKWGDILRVNGEKLGKQGMLAFNLWLRNAFRENKPLDRMVDELVTAQGSIFTNGPANYFRVATSPDDLAETTAQVFMGVRLQCAKCHHHPFESYGQDDYYGLAAYFSRIRTKGSQEFGLFGGEQVVYVAQSGDVYQPRTGKKMAPRPLNAEPSDDPIDRRRALAKWLTGKSNPWLARNIVNRYWGYLLGEGLVNPIDDMRETNPPSNPELLDALSSEFVKTGFDLKKLLRLILTSKTYQLSSLPTPENRLDTTFFTHYTLKRLTAEQLLDAINLATGTFEKFPLQPAGTRAISLPDSTYSSYFLDTFGRPQRVQACECERSTDPNLSQALNLLNGDVVNRKVLQADGRLTRVMRDPKLSDESLIQTLYLATFNRPARPEEVSAAVGILATSTNRSNGAQDLFWGLLNSKEFLFNH